LFSKAFKYSQQPGLAKSSVEIEAKGVKETLQPEVVDQAKTVLVPAPTCKPS